jgi:malonyl-CoA decarboxylase
MHRTTLPQPLRASPETSTSITSSEPTSGLEEKHRLVELVDTFVHGYHDLPSLSLSNVQNDTTAMDTPVCERVQILTFLASRGGPDMDTVESAVQRYRRHQSSVFKKNNILRKDLVDALSNLRKSLTPPYEKLFELILQQNAKDAMEFLISLREDLLQLKNYWRDRASITCEETSGRLSQLVDLDQHLQSMFTTWFAPGLLNLRRITYDQTPASVIEFISVKEAVHPLKSLKDLRSRLGPRRRVFALFHPLLPDIPLVFVHIALIESKRDNNDLFSVIPSSLKDVMDMDKVDVTPSHRLDSGHFTPKVATFYSISNGVKGLAGVGLGEFLLKEAIQALKKDLPSLETFVTLSPIPGFRKWLQVKLEQHNDESLLSVQDRQRLVECGLVSPNKERETFPWNELWDHLKKEDFTLFGGYNKDTREASLPKNSKVSVLHDVLSKLTCRYLVYEKHRGKPLDGVCKFHVGNGATIHNVRFAADVSRIGLNNSFGMMCNYLYDLDQLQHNCASFESNYTVPISPSIQHWLSEEDKE